MIRDKFIIYFKKRSKMGGVSSKASEVVKAEGNFTQESLKDESFSVINMHLPSGFSGASAVLLVLGLCLAG